MTTIAYNYANMEAAIADSNHAIKNMQQACDDIDAGYNQLANVHEGQTRDAVVGKNHVASQRRQELLTQFTALNQLAIQKMEENQQIDRNGANALLG
jgi:uncharacterized protein YukE